MKQMQITSMKQFMNQLLVADTFESFLLEEAVISTACTFHIDGHVNQEFFGSDEDPSEKDTYEFRPWGKVKGLCFDLIKGKRTPLFFRFVLHLMPDKAAALLEKENCDVEPSEVKAGSKATLTTGTALNSFHLSKMPDAIWDKALHRFLDIKGIAYEELD